MTDYDKMLCIDIYIQVKKANTLPCNVYSLDKYKAQYTDVMNGLREAKCTASCIQTIMLIMPAVALLALPVEQWRTAEPKSLVSSV